MTDPAPTTDRADATAGPKGAGETSLQRDAINGIKTEGPKGSGETSLERDAINGIKTDEPKRATTRSPRGDDATDGITRTGGSQGATAGGSQGATAGGSQGATAGGSEAATAGGSQGATAGGSQGATAGGSEGTTAVRPGRLDASDGITTTGGPPDVHRPERDPTPATDRAYAATGPDRPHYDASLDPDTTTLAATPADADAFDRLGVERPAGPEATSVGLRLPFRTRITVALVAAAVLPLAAFGIVLLVSGAIGSNSTLARILLFAIVVAGMLAIFVAYLLAADLTRPLRAIAAAVDRVSAGDLGARIDVPGDDELARLVESHNRLAADLERRNRELEEILRAVEASSPRDGIGWLVGRAGEDARRAFGLIDASVILADPQTVPIEEDIPGEARPVRAEVRSGPETVGVLVGHLPPTRTWERADQDLLELFAGEVGVAIRNAELFATVEAQNEQLLELDAAKDDFLRGVSHNLQTPLTSIRAYADQLAADRPDRRLGIISEQSERLSRMVRQLLTVTRLESGALRPTFEVVALGPRVRRAWEAIAVEEIPFTLVDRSAGWLAIADVDQLDQVLWALLDNAVKYGRHGPVEVEVAPETGGPGPGGSAAGGRLRLTVCDHGPGVAEADRGRLFGRFERGTNQKAEDGSGLGLYVSRELVGAMGGDLVLEPPSPDGGAAFSVYLPAESGLEQ
jgi:signal transduction histidine kinase